MQPAGDSSENIIAKWREVGEWWHSEPQREFTRFIDDEGIRREKCKELNPLETRPPAPLEPETDENTEDWDLKIKKRRDEKVAMAVGYLPPDPIDFPELIAKRNPTKGYAALQIISGYSFGRGTMLTEEIPILAAQAGIHAAALVDHFSLTGAVEFDRASKKAGIKPLIGATVELEEGGRIVLIARSKRGYENLSRLITTCHLDEPIHYPLCNWSRLAEFSNDLLCLSGGHLGPINIALAREDFARAEYILQKLKTHLTVIIQIERSYLPWEIAVNNRLRVLAECESCLCVAGGLVTHARPEHFICQDVITCADTLCTIDEIIGRKLTRDELQVQITPFPERALNAERYLHTEKEMSVLYADHPEWIENTLRVADMCDDSVLPTRTRLPELYDNPNHVIREIVYAGAWKHHTNITPSLKKRIDFELDRICRLNFANHFLTMWDACNWARENNILFSGRGSVVDSVVAHCMGFSRIDAHAHKLHFDRFLPEDGSKRPDIDIDFEAHRREEIRGYLTKKYGIDRVATVAAIGTYRTRGIVREVGKVMGLPSEIIGFLAKKIHGGISPRRLEASLESRPELANSGIPRERFRWVLELAERMMDIPRNIRCHSSGVVISDRPLSETVPVMWSASQVDDPDAESEEALPVNLRIIQWDKRSAKHYFDKFDILCLRGQDVLSGTQKRLRVSEPSFNVEKISLEDEETYRTMRSGELIGIPQSASPAMRQAHIRLKTANLHDASLVQAGIRPGVGGAVKINELIARRRGKPFTFEHPDLEEILSLTYGIIVFQEQVDQLLQKFAAYSSGEAEDTREAIHKRRGEDYGRQIKAQIIDRILGNGYSPVVAEHVFELVAGFKGYGFAQGHALAFAEISIRSIYCQQNFPAQYFASLLSAQPAGYYGPCTLVNEARNRGVPILPASVNQSEIEFTVEDIQSAMDPKLILPNAAIRVGLMQIHGLSLNLQRHLVTQERPFKSFFDFVRRVNPNRDELETLILCGALGELHPNRRALLWSIPNALEFAQNNTNKVQPTLNLEFREPTIDAQIRDFSEAERALHQRKLLGLDITHHLMAYERERVRSKGGITGSEVKSRPAKTKCIVVGNPIRLRFPPTPSGKRVVFFDLEDETGLLNVTCFDATYRRDGHAIVCSPYVTLLGETQDRDGHMAFLAHRVFPYSPALATQTQTGIHMPIRSGDFLVR
ncbi:MAG: DNA polymerase III subunit alpha [Armatimonadetes bacterium]|nr:DNA polymerase III subunit alpha [Armatimonadota bacterium]